MTNFLATLPEEFAERLVEHVQFEMEPGRRYDPFSNDNFAEALNEASITQLNRLAAIVRGNTPSRVNKAFRQLASEYWFDYACKAEVDYVQEQLGQEEMDGPDLPWKEEVWERNLPSFLCEQAGMR